MGVIDIRERERQRERAIETAEQALTRGEGETVATVTVVWLNAHSALSATATSQKGAISPSYDTIQ
jgi:hypothetical protein